MDAMDVAEGNWVTHKIVGIPSPAKIVEVKRGGEDVTICAEGSEQTYLVTAKSLSPVGEESR